MVKELEKTIPGKFVFTEKATTDGFYYFEKFDRVDQSNILGTILFKFYPKDKLLFISELKVKLKQKRIGSMLISKILTEYPKTKTLKSVLGLDNFTVFLKNKKLGLSDIKALKQTPAYKIRKRLGFEKIKKKTLDIDYEDESIIFEVERTF
jgi:hypothetical protein